MIWKLSTLHASLRFLESRRIDAIFGFSVRLQPIKIIMGIRGIFPLGTVETRWDVYLITGLWALTFYPGSVYW